MWYFVTRNPRKLIHYVLRQKDLRGKLTEPVHYLHSRKRDGSKTFGGGRWKGNLGKSKGTQLKRVPNGAPYIACSPRIS